jgi:hypothetical protein
VQHWQSFWCGAQKAWQKGDGRMSACVGHDSLKVQHHDTCLFTSARTTTLTHWLERTFAIKKYARI